MLPLNPRLLVFDLDGTLIDSRIDLTNSVNATLNHFGQPSLPGEIIAGYIGDGVTELVRRSLGHAHLIAERPNPHDDAFVQQAVEWFIGYYKVHKLDFTYAYPGVLESLAELRRRRPELPMAVLTNKPVKPSRAICEGLGLSPYFFQNYGGNSFATKKPDPEGLLAIVVEASSRLGDEVYPYETVLVGDSHVDVETARNAGTAVLGCAYGLSRESLLAAGPDHVVESAYDWPEVLFPA